MDALDVGQASHIGHLRSNNEDSLLVLPGGTLIAVADGMGGHAHGEVASRIAVATLGARMTRGKSLIDAFHAAHRAVREAWGRGEGSPEMGTTLVAARLDAGAFQVAWVGDSRAYLWHDGALTRLTRDHTLAQELVERGVLDEARAALLPASHMLTRALSAGPRQRQVELDPETRSGTLAPGDGLLLCSDGLTHLVEDAAIAGLLAAGGTAQARVDRLVTAALDAGGVDNVTVVLALWPGGAP